MKKALSAMLIFTIIVRVAAFAFALLIVSGAIVFFTKGADEPPKAEDARYAAQTYVLDPATNTEMPSRLYFSESVVMDGNVPTITNYWQYDGEKYRHVNKTKELSGYSHVQITDRRLN